MSYLVLPIFQTYSTTDGGSQPEVVVGELSSESPQNATVLQEVNGSPSLHAIARSLYFMCTRACINYVGLKCLRGIQFSWRIGACMVAINSPHV